MKLVFEEKDDKFVEPLHKLFFRPNSPSEFLWLSNRDGWKHLYLYDVQDGLKKQVTSGEWEITQFNGFLNNDEVLITSTKVSPLERHCYIANIENSKLTQITKGKGIF